HPCAGGTANRKPGGGVMRRDGLHDDRRGAVWLLGLAALALLVPATATAAPADGARAKDPLRVRSVSAPPREALAGESFRIVGKVRNLTRRATRPRLLVSLRAKRDGAGRQLAAKRLARVK